MIVVRLELWPNGDQRAKRDLGTMRIENDQTGTAEVGNYMYKIRRGEVYALGPGLLRQGRLVGFSRRQHVAAPWELLRAILNQTFN